MAVANAKAGKKGATKKNFKVSEVLGLVYLENVTLRTNSKGTQYVPVPGHGAVYANREKIQPGLHKVVMLTEETSDDSMLALHEPTRDDRNKFISEKMQEFTGFTRQDIIDDYNL